MNQEDKELFETQLIGMMNPKFHEDGRRILKQLLEDRDKQIEELTRQYKQALLLLSLHGCMMKRLCEYKGGCWACWDEYIKEKLNDTTT